MHEVYLFSIPVMILSTMNSGIRSNVMIILVDLVVTSSVFYQFLSVFNYYSVIISSVEN